MRNRSEARLSDPHSATQINVFNCRRSKELVFAIRYRCEQTIAKLNTVHAFGSRLIISTDLRSVYGAMAGVGGTYLSIAYTPLWVEDMTAGRGWISLALVVFATWRPARVIFGAWLLGGMTIMQLQGQALGAGVPSEVLSSLPYVAKIVVLVIISQNRQMLVLNFPASLGKPFRPAG